MKFCEDRSTIPFTIYPPENPLYMETELLWSSPIPSQPCETKHFGYAVQQGYERWWRKTQGLAVTLALMKSLLVPSVVWYFLIGYSFVAVNHPSYGFKALRNRHIYRKRLICSNNITWRCADSLHVSFKVSPFCKLVRDAERHVYQTQTGPWNISAPFRVQLCIKLGETSDYQNYTTCATVFAWCAVIRPIVDYAHYLLKCKVVVWLPSQWSTSSQLAATLLVRHRLFCR